MEWRDRQACDRLLDVELSRRRALIGLSATASLALASSVPATAHAAAPFRLPADPFTLGVASGDPWRDSVVLWTRLATEPLNADGRGGLPPVAIPVQWTLAADEGLTSVVDRGWTRATPELGHSVHVEVYGLRPDTWYWYRFRVGDYLSPVGRTRTLPAQTSTTQRLRFAFVSCQDYENGFYAAYRALAQEDLDLVVHLGDYIYEYAADPTKPRQHLGGEITTLADYRLRHALYKRDPHLRAAHSAFPFLCTPDDHEVENNYAGGISEADSEPDQDPALFVQRRANAYQAYYEHLPLRRSALPRGSRIALYRRFTVGDLAEFSLLDTRQYRTDQPCGDGVQLQCADALSEAQTMTGPNQERWLLQGLERSRARWNIIAQQTMMGELEVAGAVVGVPGASFFNVDQWDGYVAARQRILSFIRRAGITNPIVLSGDIHSNWVQNLKLDFKNPASPTVATEFVGTSITSDFPAAFIPAIQASLPLNPHTAFFDGQYRGYVRCEVTPSLWRTDFRVVDSIVSDSSPVRTLRSFVVQAGTPGALPA
jgi:alkaline phosphatase D